MNAPLPPQYGAPLTLDRARLVMAAAEAEAERHGWPMVIAIYDSTAHLLMLHRMDHAQLGSVLIAQRKAETAVLMRRASKGLEDALAAGSLRQLAIPGVTPLEGGLPLFVDGKVVGSIGVSGMTAADDSCVAEAGAAALTGSPDR